MIGMQMQPTLDVQKQCKLVDYSASKRKNLQRRKVKQRSTIIEKKKLFTDQRQIIETMVAMIYSVVLIIVFVENGTSLSRARACYC